MRRSAQEVEVILQVMFPGMTVLRTMIVPATKTLRTTTVLGMMALRTTTVPGITTLRMMMVPGATALRTITVLGTTTLRTMMVPGATNLRMGFLTRDLCSVSLSVPLGQNQCPSQVPGQERNDQTPQKHVSSRKYQHRRNISQRQ